MTQTQAMTASLAAARRILARELTDYQRRHAPDLDKIRIRSCDGSGTVESTGTARDYLDANQDADDVRAAVLHLATSPRGTEVHIGGGAWGDFNLRRIR